MKRRTFNGELLDVRAASTLLGGSERVPARICGTRPCALSQAWVSRRVSPV
jgi:hypothetical protein